VLVHGYQRIDPYLVLPDTRAAIEAACDRVARGLQSKEQVDFDMVNSVKIFYIFVFGVYCG
jgi:hypothetical protein